VVPSAERQCERVPIVGDEVAVESSCAIVGLRGFTALVVAVELPPANHRAPAATAASRHGESWPGVLLTLRHAPLPTAPSAYAQGGHEGGADPEAMPAGSAAVSAAAGVAIEAEVHSVEAFGGPDESDFAPLSAPTLAAAAAAADADTVVAAEARLATARHALAADAAADDKARARAERVGGPRADDLRASAAGSGLVAAGGSGAGSAAGGLLPSESQRLVGSSGDDAALLAAFGGDAAVSLEAFASSAGAVSRGPTESVVPAADVRFARRNVVGAFGYSWTLRGACVAAGLLAVADVFFVPALLLLLATRYRLHPHRNKVGRPFEYKQTNHSR